MNPFARASVVVRCVVSVAVLLSGGCAMGPDFRQPAAPDAQQYTRGAQPTATASAGGTNGTAQSFAVVPAAPYMWWTTFGCAPLDRLVDAALRNSPTLEAARARLRQAEENYRAEAGQVLLPAVDASLSATRKQVDLSSVGLPNVASPGPFTLYDASVSVSYALDLFGANRRALEATRAHVDYDGYELEAARLTLAGNVVSAAIRRASLQRQIRLTQEIERYEARRLEIMEGRMRAGGLAEFDVRAQRALLAQTRAALAPLETQHAQAEHRLAVLTGEAPSVAAFDDIALEAIRLPADLPLTLPSTLARERPDIRAAEALLHEASANVGVATANLYPQIVISAGAGSERRHIRNLLDSLNVWNVGASLTQPIFHGGALHAQRRAAMAAYDAALADYRETVLGALQQVADVLRALQHDAIALAERDRAARQQQGRADIAASRHAAGGISEAELIEAQRAALDTLLDRTKAEADRLSDTAALFQSLGGTPLDGAAPIARKRVR
ncbi:efflux transporter outer membrane subunit [Trinickia caryophylli]|uniref:Efflux transporter, outer membrane factor (OMF) lipoprotein, NodT family n=1 Tax=Trinickia caryophylli TaxID=28094 RepID=A0A1X7GFK6_TRICW|nr:efflux transporter outer membrane subunit [Trinickia caryophylli]PMS10734.1 ABC transporter permease [Trinickia caryophylli]TRX13891.1 efflux transporter outer membrane subunit [Trinickia caryophylli]WQE15481.1 efflux transporter outer membrane subunit [Trinickia caryophylli]SMF69070.1 efflux transporter, outer membrane factor (OMF) lipoprotein, NodT family [Trinickia caryophylli]GLU33775.1 histidine kinase [Trinickia caryophylli]